jgi:hypothetical protein
LLITTILFNSLHSCILVFFFFLSTYTSSFNPCLMCSVFLLFLMYLHYYYLDIFYANTDFFNYLYLLVLILNHLLDCFLSIPVLFFIFDLLSRYITIYFKVFLIPLFSIRSVAWDFAIFFTSFVYYIISSLFYNPIASI